MQCEKEDLKYKFRKYFKIKLFTPRQGGGTFIDGNAVRDCFKRPELFARLIDFPVDLIRDFYTLITAIVSGADIKPAEYKALADSWLDRFHNSSHNWNILSPTLHLILHHGKFIKHKPLISQE